ncbi:hypothetical protein Rmf_40310 [Roseomonas fluvialis]|uniref:Uncharacterized protein n=1 Tax=Roseomonas fluvialis TaxID=1750527 RepID=A0ABM7Y7Z8_9PROT|nr:hypothetical protein Rmf_40310 [Roseomonas fluvialis]
MVNEHPFVLINNPFADDRDVNTLTLPFAVGSGIISAAEGVLSAAREAGSIDAERVLQAVIELLRAAGSAQAA